MHRPAVVARFAASKASLHALQRGGFIPSDAVGPTANLVIVQQEFGVAHLQHARVEVHFQRIPYDQDVRFPQHDIALRYHALIRLVVRRDIAGQ